MSLTFEFVEGQGIGARFQERSQEEIRLARAAG